MKYLGVPQIEVRRSQIPLNEVQSNTVVPIRHVRSLDLLAGTPESPKEHCDKARGTLMSPQECKIAWCTPNELEMKRDSPALAPEASRVPHLTRQWLDFL